MSSSPLPPDCQLVTHVSRTYLSTLLLQLLIYYVRPGMPELPVVAVVFAFDIVLTATLRTTVCGQNIIKVAVA